jgi:hypothetical protein
MNTQKREGIKVEIEGILATEIIRKIVINDKYRFAVNSVMVGTYYLDYYTNTGDGNIDLDDIIEVGLKGDTLEVWTN